MPRFQLGRAGVAAVHRAIEALFLRAKARFLGKQWGPKRIAFGVVQNPVGVRDDLTLGAMHDAASRAQGMPPSAQTRTALDRQVEQLLDAHQEMAKHRVVHAVESFLSDSERGVTEASVDKVLGGQLADVLGKIRHDVLRVVDSEVTRARNIGATDAIVKVAAATGVDDPTVAFLGPNDNLTCEVCKKIFFLSDGVTPRCWKMSEVKAGYFKRGDDRPSVSGCHPFCRHSVVSVLLGYGFVGGKIQYVAPDHDELLKQRSG